MAHRGVGDQLLDVGLDHGHEGAVDDTDHRQDHHDPADGRAERHLRKQRHREPEEAVGPDLEHHGGQQHAARGRCLDVGIRQPGVERKDRHLDREGDRERREEPGSERAHHTRVLQHMIVGEGDVARDALDSPHQRHDRHQHQQRAGHGVDEELDGGVEPVGAAPDPDDEIHRDQHDLEEDVEQEEVEGDEDADQAGEQREHQRVEPALLLRDVAPAAEHADGHQGGREKDHHERDAIDPDAVADAPVGDPWRVRHQLQRAARRVEGPPEPERQHELERGDDESRPLGGRLGAQKHRHDAEERQDDEQVENPLPVAEGVEKLGHRRVTGSWRAESRSRLRGRARRRPPPARSAAGCRATRGRARAWRCR